MMNHHTRSMSFNKEIFTLMQEENQLDSMHKHVPEGRKENHYEVGEGGTKKCRKIGDMFKPLKYVLPKLSHQNWEFHMPEKSRL